MRMNQAYEIRSFQRQREYARDMKILQFQEAIERQRSLARSISRSPIPKDTHHTKRTSTQQSITNMRAQANKNPYMAGSQLRRQPKPYKPAPKDEYYDSRGSKQLQYLQSQEYCQYLQSILNPPRRAEDIVQKIRQTRNNNVYLEKHKHKESSFCERQQPRNSKAKPLQARQKRDYSYLAHSLQNMSKITDDEYILINDPSSNNLLSREAYLEDNQQLELQNKPRISRNPSGSIQLARHDQECRHENTIELPSKIYHPNRRDSGELGYLAKENAKTITKTAKSYAHLYERSSPLVTSSKANIKQNTPSKLKHTPSSKRIQWTPISEIEKSKARKQNIQNRGGYSPLHLQSSEISYKNDKQKQPKEHIPVKQTQLSTKRQKTPQKCYKVYEQSSTRNEQLHKVNLQTQHQQSRQSLQSNIYCIDFKLTRPGKPSSFARAPSTADLSDNASNHSRSHSKTKMSVVSISGKRNK